LYAADICLRELFQNVSEDSSLSSGEDIMIIFEVSEGFKLNEM
jgi:hypothetical protein